MNELLDINKKQLVPFAQNSGALALAEQVKATVQAKFLMAYQCPRDTEDARQRLLASCRRPGFAKKAIYHKPIGKGIEGPSIRFAEEAIRTWGNIDVDTLIIFEDEFVRKIRVTCTDLERNASFAKSLTIDKTVERSNKKDRDVISQRTNSKGSITYIVKATEDELNQKEAALISKAIRNEGLRLIPDDIVEEALAIVKKTRSGSIEKNISDEQKRIFDAFAQLGIQPKQLREYIGHNNPFDANEIGELRAIYQTINDGEAKFSDYLEQKESEATKEADDLNQKYAKKKEEPKDVTEAEVVPDNEPEETPVDPKEEFIAYANDHLDAVNGIIVKAKIEKLTYKTYAKAIHQWVVDNQYDYGSLLPLVTETPDEFVKEFTDELTKQ